MMSLAKPHKSVKDMLHKPAKIIPLLSQYEIQTLLIQAIQLYRKRTIPLETLTKCAGNIIRYKNAFLSDDVLKILDEIQSFSTIDSVLADILHELKEEKKEKTYHS
jgi:ABC-type uncharacterized transport system ATPase subunit